MRRTLFTATAAMLRGVWGNFGSTPQQYDRGRLPTFSPVWNAGDAGQILRMDFGAAPRADTIPVGRPRGPTARWSLLFRWRTAASALRAGDAASVIRRNVQRQQLRGGHAANQI